MRKLFWAAVAAACLIFTVAVAAYSSSGFDVGLNMRLNAPLTDIVVKVAAATVVITIAALMLLRAHDPHLARRKRIPLFALIAGPFVALALAGCTTTKLDADIQKNLPAICTAATQAHDLYVMAVAAGKVSAKNQSRADAAWASLSPMCADPASQTTASVITAAFAAYLTISSAAH